MPETPEAVRSLADTMITRFTPPSFVPGCEVQSVADIDEYATNNGWIEAIVGGDNQQRVRYYGTPQGVAVNDFVDVEYFPAYKLYRVFGSTLGGTAATGGVRVDKVWDNTFGAVALQTDASGNAEFKQNILLTKGGGGVVGPQINLESASAGAVDSEFAFFAAGAGSTTDAQGPNFGMRGNTFSRAANQRGRLFFNAGNVSTPIGDDAAISFTAYNFHKFLISSTELMEIISTGVGIGVTPNAAVKLQVRVATDQNVIISNASGESRISAINDAFGAFVDLGIVGDPLIFRGASAVETARLTTTSFDLATAYMEMDEITAPAAGAANTTRTYAEDSAGTTRQRVKFSSGNAVTIAEDGGLQTYTVTNDATDRTYDADATSVAELADVLGTLIADFQAAGVLG